MSRKRSCTRTGETLAGRLPGIAGLSVASGRSGVADRTPFVPKKEYTSRYDTDCRQRLDEDRLVRRTGRPVGAEIRDRRNESLFSGSGADRTHAGLAVASPAGRSAGPKRFFLRRGLRVRGADRDDPSRLAFAAGRPSRRSRKRYAGRRPGAVRGAIRGSPAFWVRGPIRAAGTGSGSPSRCRRSDSFSATRGAGPCWAAGWSATA